MVTWLKDFSESLEVMKTLERSALDLGKECSIAE